MYIYIYSLASKWKIEYDYDEMRVYLKKKVACQYVIIYLGRNAAGFH